MRPFRIASLLALLITAPAALAADAYLLRFTGTGKTAMCVSARWRGDVYFYNQNPSPSVVTLLGISNGTLAPGTPMTLTLPPGEIVALSDPRQPPWVPASQSNGDNFFVLHLDIPENVIVESRDEVVMINNCIQGMVREPFVKVSLPIIRALTPPDTPQIKVGTDSGSTPAHQNVAIYNAGTQLATARVEVRRACDNAVMDQRTVTITPNTVLQVNGLTTGEKLCPNPFIPVYARYTVVTVDQPSFSIVSTITEPQPDSAGLVPRVEMTIGISSQF